ncbi:hypothetical protein PoB_002195500 [Plakobranchus ocellatus]|uniref:AMP-binding enzyme C-terminal domain-containing protein n=1 Tax=Plakobranchus ocellatus TaxID=259542 RepID=A0AAV3ZIH6_9GAST|nr:hypothetical protein PoB_002195500 [Plakobranchus ocellatus]
MGQTRTQQGTTGDGLELRLSTAVVRSVFQRYLAAAVVHSWREKGNKAFAAGYALVIVVPIPDEENFQNICACVIKKPEKNELTSQDIKAYFRANYVDEEKDSLCPNDVVFLESFPESRSGQVDRGKLAVIAMDMVFKARNRIASAKIEAVNSVSDDTKF